MKQSIRSLALVPALMLSVGAGALAATTATAAESDPSRLAPLATAVGEAGVSGRYIVVLKQAASTDAAADRARGWGAEVTREFDELNGYTARLSAAELRQVRQDPAVAFVEQDQVVSASATQTNPPWGLDRIDQRDLPLNAQYTYTPTGSGVDAYIIDTGIRTTHSQFTGRTAPGFSAISDRNGATTNDCNGHGTHVAGTVGGTTYGVAKQVTLIPVRVLDCQGNGTDSGVIAGMDWVAANASGPSVANMSLGGSASAALDAAVARMTNAGITVVVAAGNENQNACNVSPARAASAITIGSTTSTDARSSFSNYGSCLDLFAPGSSILSAWYTSNSASATISGTSMASPHVAGVAALYLQGNPTATPSAVTSAITSTATPGKVTSPGTGSPNLLLYSPLNGAAPPPPAVAPNVTLDPANQTAAAGGNATFTSAATGSPTPTVQWQVDTGSGFTNLGGATSTTLTLTGVTVGMNGYDYRAVFTNAGGSDTSASANLTVTSPPPPPPPPSADCDETVTGNVDSRSMAVATSFVLGSSGRLTGCLTGPSGTNFDLYLDRWDGRSWVRVATGQDATSTENVTVTSAAAGSYRWVVNAISGSGTYTLKFGRP